MGEKKCSGKVVSSPVLKIRACRRGLVPAQFLSREWESLGSLLGLLLLGGRPLETEAPVLGSLTSVNHWRLEKLTLPWLSVGSDGLGSTI